jgi:hypothetical protein
MAHMFEHGFLNSANKRNIPAFRPGYLIASFYLLSLFLLRRARSVRMNCLKYALSARYNKRSDHETRCFCSRIVIYMPFMLYFSRRVLRIARIAATTCTTSSSVLTQCLFPLLSSQNFPDSFIGILLIKNASPIHPCHLLLPRSYIALILVLLFRKAFSKALACFLSRASTPSRPYTSRT